MSTSGITTSLFSEIVSSSSTANQFATDLNQLAQDLESSNLSAAQDDYVTLANDALNGATASTADTSSSEITPSLLSNVAGSASASESFVSELNQLGSDLQSGNLTSAQEDMLSLDSTALGAASAASSASSTTSNTTASSTATDQAATSALIQAAVEAMSSGDDSAASTALAQLASSSTSSAGASYLQQMSNSLSSGSSLLDTSTSALSLLA